MVRDTFRKYVIMHCVIQTILVTLIKHKISQNYHAKKKLESVFINCVRSDIISEKFILNRNNRKSQNILENPRNVLLLFSKLVRNYRKMGHNF